MQLERHYQIHQPTYPWTIHMSLFDLSIQLVQAGISALPRRWDTEEKRRLRNCPIRGYIQGCRYLEPNANNKLTFREMHEPIYGFHRHGLAPESLTPENSEKFDVATVSAQSALGSRAFDPCFCFGHVPSTESVFSMGWMESSKKKKIIYIPSCNNFLLQANNKARGQCHAFHCWLHSGVRSLDQVLGGGGRKSYSSAY